MLNLKHMVSRKTFFVHGMLSTKEGATDQPHANLSIAAFSNAFQKHELVDAMHQLKANVHYGLNLPPGEYELLVFADINGNGLYESHEVIGRESLSLAEKAGTENVAGQRDVMLGEARTLEWPVSLQVVSSKLRQQSLFFPPNTLRTLDDPLFDPAMSALGMYHPAAFIEQAGTMFYALEEDVGHKIPVVFVHGINGSARDFETIVGRLDRTRFKPWFFHYASGGDLNQTSRLFFDIFLSGKVIPNDETFPIVVVAHSMGGLVVREAINKLASESKMKLTFVSVSSPFGGHPAAASGEKNGLLVLPSWRDLNPSSDFIRNLYRRPIPDSASHRLVYGFGNPDTLKLGENSDGTVPLSSQLHFAAQRQATEQKGFNASHMGILNDPNAVDYVLTQIHQVKVPYPDIDMFYLMQGGYDYPLDARYTPMEKYMIGTYGKYMRALIQKKVTPSNTHTQNLLDVALGKRKASTDGETAWLKFTSDYPDVLKPD